MPPKAAKPRIHAGDLQQLQQQLQPNQAVENYGNNLDYPKPNRDDDDDDDDDADCDDDTHSPSQNPFGLLSNIIMQ